MEFTRTDPMKSDTEDLSPLALRISEVEARLEKLESEIDEIGQPAAHDLKKRFDALRIEEKALQRNFEESVARGEPDAVRIEKIEALLRHIQNEESSMEHEADFLHQSAPSSVTLAAQAAAGMIDLYRRALKKVLGDHHPLGESVFVNHSHENLSSDFGLKDSSAAKTDDT